jgi:phage virion morphogenesis protein
MTGVTLTLGPEAQELQETLRQLQTRLGDLRIPLADVGEYLLRSHRQRWNAQESPDGIKWTPLSRAYAARKPKNADKILVLNGYLRDLLRYQVTNDTLEFGTDRPYGALHQFGARQGAFGIQTVSIKAHQRKGRPVKAHQRRQAIPWGNVPARPWLGLSAADEGEILTLFGQYLEP